MDLFEFADKEEAKKRNELEELRAVVESYALSYDTDVASEKFLHLVVKRMGRHLTESSRRRIILGALYTIRRETDEATFENVLNAYIHYFDLRCHDWDVYYAERKGYTRR